MRCVDAAFLKLSLPPFYSPPRPHVSVAWAVGDCEEKFNRIVTRWQALDAGAAASTGDGGLKGEDRGNRSDAGQRSNGSGGVATAAEAAGSAPNIASAGPRSRTRSLGVAVDTVEVVIGKRTFAVWGTERQQPGQKAAFLPPRPAGGGGGGQQ